MYRDVRQWHYIRRRILEEGIPKKRVARETGISRRTINKMLTHEHPPGYAPRRRTYPKLGPFVHTVDQLMHDHDAFPSATDMTIQAIVEHLRRDGFAGSYHSVRNYIKRCAGDESEWERAYDLIIRLPKPRALDLLRLLSGGIPPAFASPRLRLFVREAAFPRTRQTKASRDGRRLIDIEWMRRVLQNELNEDTLRRELDNIPDLHVLLQHLHHGRLQDRNRVMVALACYRQIPKQTICDFLGVSKGFVRKYQDKFDSGGAKIMFAPQTKANRKIDNGDLKSAVFTLLHEPPTNHGINRTSWTKALLCQGLERTMASRSAQRLLEK